MKYFFISFLCLITFVAADAQNGGKAEPTRIQFAAGATSTTLSGTLSNGQEMDFIFAATKGQTVSITNSTKNLFDFKVYNEEHFSEGDFDSSASYAFEIPETGDYMFFVRKKQVKSPRTARFSMRLTIK
ncbi:MAG: hypothetical protein ABL959_16070 [Pyrinomonadaceae bacterium]